MSRQSSIDHKYLIHRNLRYIYWQWSNVLRHDTCTVRTGLNRQAITLGVCVLSFSYLIRSSVAVRILTNEMNTSHVWSAVCVFSHLFRYWFAVDNGVHIKYCDILPRYFALPIVGVYAYGCRHIMISTVPYHWHWPLSNHGRKKNSMIKFHWYQPKRLWALD